MDAPSDLIRTSEASRILGVKDRQTRNYANRGYLRHWKYPRLLLFDRADVERFRAERERQKAAA